MIVRLIMPADEAAVVALSARAVQEGLSDIGFDPDVVLETIRDHGANTIYVCEEHGHIVGAAIFRICGYTFARGFYVVLEGLYVCPERRGTRAAARLIKQFLAFAKEVGAKQAVAGPHAGFRNPRTVGLFRAFGFTPHADLLALSMR